jgi:hypothetical protein
MKFMRSLCCMCVGVSPQIVDKQRLSKHVPAATSQSQSENYFSSWRQAP